MADPSSSGAIASAVYVALASAESKAAFHSKPAIWRRLPLTGAGG